MLAEIVTVSVFASVTVFAASEKKIQTNEGGFLTITNVVKEIKYTNEGNGDTIYVANKPVAVTIKGKNLNPSLGLHPQAELKNGSLSLGEAREDLIIQGNSITLTKPGHYSGTVRFGDGYTPDNTAQFDIEIVEGAAATKPSATKPAISNKVGVSIDGKAIELNPGAKVVKGNMFIPLRGVFEKLFATLDWDKRHRS